MHEARKNRMNREHECRLHPPSRSRNYAREVVAVMNSGAHSRGKSLQLGVPDSEPDPEKALPKWAELRGLSLLDAVPDAILMLDQGGNIVVANLQAEKLVGYERDELIGRSVESIIPARLWAGNMQHGEILFDEPSARPLNVGLQLFVLRKDGTEIPVEINFKSITNQEGKLIVCAIRDATDRRRTDGLKILDAVLRESRESDERFGLLADSAPALIWMSDGDNLCSYVNKLWLDLTGRSMDCELGEGWAEGIHPDDLRSRKDTYERAFGCQEEFRTEYRLRRHDGEYRWILDIGVPRFDHDHSFVGYIGIGIDVTDHKLAEAALARVSRKLIEAQEHERARIGRELHDDFSQRVAMLAIGLAQLSSLLPKSEAEGRARIQEMLNGAKELSADLHSLSHQLHSSKLELVGLTSALNGLCKEINQKYGVAIHFNQTAVPVDIPKDLALCLFRVAQEALGNVVKHSQAKEAWIELCYGARQVTLHISDPGRGFDPRKENSSVGIGLIGMRERLRLVNGILSIKSALDHGTEILAEVPLTAVAVETKHRTQAAGR
jgi:PAS domain S-box-containing protein